MTTGLALPGFLRRPCESCGQKKRDTKYDRGTRKHLCNECWFGTRPAMNPRMFFGRRKDDDAGP